VIILSAPDLVQAKNQPLKLHVELPHGLVLPALAPLKELGRHLGDLRDLHLHEPGLDPLQEVVECLAAGQNDGCRTLLRGPPLPSHRPSRTPEP